MRVLVLHGGYGCDTGCCGHWIELGDDQTPREERLERFVFGHPGSDQDRLAWAKELVRDVFGEEHVKDLDWDHCVIEDGGHL